MSCQVQNAPSYFATAVSYTSKKFIKSTKVKSKVNFSFLGGWGYRPLGPTQGVRTEGKLGTVDLLIKVNNIFNIKT
jgi:hypothetical protein